MQKLNRIVEVQEPIAIGCDATEGEKNYISWKHKKLN
jgi:hypothetical protein